MDILEQFGLRAQTEQRRQCPAASQVIVVSFGRGGRFENPEHHGPFEIRLEATDGGGSTAVWLNDGWWADLLQRWGDDPVTLTIEPTRDALLHPVVLHQLEMVRRVTPVWRVVGIAYRDDVADAAAVQLLVISPYHEVRFIDAPRGPCSGDQRAEAAPTLSELLAAIRREQDHAGRSTPVLVRLPDTGAHASKSGAIRREAAFISGT